MGGMKKDQLLQTFATNLARGMERAGLNQTALAKRSGIAQTHISRLLRCTSGATLDTIATLAEALRMQPWELLVNDEETRAEILQRILGADAVKVAVLRHPKRRSG